MISSKRQGWLGETQPAAGPHPVLVGAALAAILFIALTNQRTDLPLVYFFKQDVPILCAMFAAAMLFAHMRFDARWQRELRISPTAAWIGAALLVVACLLGHRFVMMAYDLSRDESMASFAAAQIASGTLVTPVPAEWQPFGRAMMPLFYTTMIAPEHAWVSGYLPANSALRALSAFVADPALANALLLIIGLFALWKVARKIFPERIDAAVVTLLLAAASPQLITNAMTSYAMTGHFALNMVWLLLFLRGGRLGVAGALFIGFLATGLHQIHFHPMFVAPFLLWLVARRQWRGVAAYGVGYLMIALFWSKLYPASILHLAGVEATEVVQDYPSIWDHIVARVGRLVEYSPGLWLLNLARFAAWQNVLLLPLALAALPLLRTRQVRESGIILPLVGACVLGLTFMVHQGHGWGYRYLHGLIGCFCLLAGYGWCRLVPVAGPGRAWAMVKCACCLTLLVLLPIQLWMAHAFVAPYARLHRAMQAAPADVILVDIGGGFYAQDLIQNVPDFSVRPKAMDLSLVPQEALAPLCRSRSVVRVDRRHYRAVGMREEKLHPILERELTARRALLARLHCAPPLAISR